MLWRLTDLEKLAKTLEAVAHGTRLRILVLLRDHDTLSPRQASDLIDGQSLGAVSHHFRRMRDAGMIELTGTRPARGALEHFYKLTDGGRRLLEDLRL